MLSIAFDAISVPIVTMQCLLRSVKLQLLVGDTKQESTQGIIEAIRLGNRGSIALVGPLMGDTAFEVARVLTKTPSLDRTIMAYTPSDTRLSLPVFSKNFLRTQPTSDEQARRAAQLIKGLCLFVRLAWTVLIIIFSEFRMSQVN